MTRDTFSLEILLDRCPLITEMTTFFNFESEFVESLRCIPMTVRMKLDTCGVKLKLSHWMQLSQPERMVLVNMACGSQEEAKIYRDFLQNLITEKTGIPAGELTIDDHPAWLDETKIPDSVNEKAREFQLEISVEQWQKLTPEQRFALIKLSRPSHENLNFYPALKEFHLLEK